MNVWTVIERLDLYVRLVRLDRPIGILLLLWPTLWGLWAASGGWPGIELLLIFVLGTVLMRSAGCAINDWADRDFDRHVARTRHRVLTSGLISGREALLVALVLTLLAALLLIPLNAMTWALALVAAVLAGTYPFFKRFFAIPQAYLGVAFGFGIPMSFAAVQAALPLEAWLLLAANVCWAIAYDTEYAMVDRSDDIKLGLKTSAITFGRFDVLAIGICYALTLALLAAAFARLGLGLAALVGLAAAGIIAVQHLRWIAKRDPVQCFRAFLHNNWFGACVFAGLMVDYARRG
jgi:4-hydroxybenzoate polyprenyltransferase